MIKIKNNMYCRFEVVDNNAFYCYHFLSVHIQLGSYITYRRGMGHKR